MRLLLACVLVAGCSSSAPEVDRLACDSCHASDYDQTRDRDGMSHEDKGFARTCYACHGTGAGRGTDGGVDAGIDAGGGDAGPGAWLPANDDHCGFPIDGEPHAGWDCYTCHALALPLDGATPQAIRDHITCTNCHWHDRARVDLLHGGRSVYDEDRCTDCHGEDRCP